MTPFQEIAAKCLRDEALALTELINQLDDNFDKAVDIILNCKGKVIITGVGKSGHIGEKIAATLSSTGTPSFFVNPLDAYHGDLGVIEKKDVVIAISNSGQTDELLRFFPFLLENEIPVIGISSNPQSLLAKNSTAHIKVSVRYEACPLGLAPTSSTTAVLAMGDALACALIEARNFKKSDFAHFHPGGSLGKQLLTKAKDVMQKENLPVINPETLLSQAVINVSQGRLGLCVAIKDEKIVGLITDGDVRRAMEKSQNKFFELTVADIMTKNPKTVSPETKIAQISRTMHKNKIHAVLVTDSDNHLLGIVDSFRTML